MYNIIKIRLCISLALFLLISGFVKADQNNDFISFSIGQFDINDSKDSAEYRVEYHPQIYL